MPAGYLGIDLGTYNSAVALSRQGSNEVVMLQTDAGAVTGGVLAFPSFISFNAKGEPEEFGDPARDKWRVSPEHVVWAFKRLLRRSYDDVASQLARFRYRIERDENGWATAVVGPRRYRPEELYRVFLEWVKKCATDPLLNEAVAGLHLQRTIVTVPAYYSEDQVRETVHAARDAGLPDPHRISEPVAAMLAYRESLREAHGQTVMCIDWGAGTLDIATGVVMVAGDDVSLESLVAPNGDPALGGLDWDYALLEAVLESAHLEEQLALLENYRTGTLTVDGHDRALKVRALAGLCRRVEDAKIDLSTVEVARVEIPGADPVFIARRVADRSMLPKDRTLVFEDVLESAGILQRFEACLDMALQEIGGPETVGRLILVGGPCCSPVVWDIVWRKFKGTPAAQDIENIREKGFPVSPMEAVARGAAMFAAEPEAHKGMVDQVPHDYGLVFEFSEEELESAARRIAEEYGVQPEPTILDTIKRNLREVVKPLGVVFIGRNDPVGTRVTKSFGRVGQPGDPVRFASFCRRYDSSGVYSEAYGGFEIVPTYRYGKAGVEMTLEYTYDEGVVIGVTDLHTGNRLELAHADTVARRPIPEPDPIPENGGDIPPTRPGDRVPVGVFNRWLERCRLLIGLARRLAVAELADLAGELEAAIKRCEAGRNHEGIEQEAFTPLTMVFTQLKHALLQAGVDEAAKL